MTPDEELGDAIRVAREQAGLTQNALATAMNGEFGWFQQTVARVEMGSRKLRYLEALGLRKIIPFDLADQPPINYYASALTRVRALIDEEITHYV